MQSVKDVSKQSERYLQKLEQENFAPADKVELVAMSNSLKKSIP